MTLEETDDRPWLADVVADCKDHYHRRLATMVGHKGVTRVFSPGDHNPFLLSLINCQTHWQESENGSSGKGLLMIV